MEPIGLSEVEDAAELKKFKIFVMIDGLAREYDFITREQVMQAKLQYGDDTRSLEEIKAELLLKVEELKQQLLTKIKFNRENAYDPSRWDLSQPPAGIAVKLGDALQTLEENGVAVRRVLDLGAGVGRNTMYLKSLGFDVIAVELERDGIETMLKAGMNPDKIFRMDAIAYLKTLPDESIDGVLDAGMSHYLDDVQKQVLGQEIRRVCKPGAIVANLHFSEQMAKKGRGSNVLDILQSGMIPVTEKEHITWEHVGNRVEHNSAYQAVAVKPGGTVSPAKIKKGIAIKPLKRSLIEAKNHLLGGIIKKPDQKRSETREKGKVRVLKKPLPKPNQGEIIISELISIVAFAGLGLLALLTYFLL